MTQKMTIPDHITLLLTRKWNGETLTDAERATLNQWLAKPAHAGEAETLHRVWMATQSYPSHYEANTDAGWNALHARISKHKAEAPKGRIAPMLRRQWWAVAASLLFLAAIGYWLRPAPEAPESVRTIGAASGQSLELSLPDGSSIVLHDGGEVSYPEPFEKSGSRWVQLSGEAYFQVAPDLSRPFQVRTDYATVEVLGTAFNVRALPGEPAVEVTVESGRVQLFNAAIPDTKMQLLPGERGICTPNGELQKTNDAEINALSWLTDKLRFRNTPLPQALQALGRHFNVRIEFEKEALSPCTYTGTFDKTELKEVLQTLELTFGARIVRQGEGGYLIRGGSCGK